MAPPEFPEVLGPDASLSMRRVGGELLVSWSTDPLVDQAYQLYCDGKLVWHGLASSARLPWPSKRCRIELAIVDIDERHVDHSSSLPAAPMGRARLAWRAGAYQAADLAGFAVYGGTTPGGAVSYAARLGYVPLSDGAGDPGGWGAGGWDEGQWDAAAGHFAWLSEPLAAGTWNFAVKAVDEAGNESTAATASVALDAPPRPPAVNSQGLRLTYTYDSGTRVPTLAWLASPDA